MNLFLPINNNIVRCSSSYGLFHQSLADEYELNEDEAIVLKNAKP